MALEQGQRWEFGHATVEGRYYDLVAQIRVAHGGGTPENEVVYVVRDDLDSRFVIGYGPANSEYLYYEQAFSYKHRYTGQGLADEYMRALRYALQRAQLR